ncbi:unnamed protein product [Schistosoma margrebowiei]|uniref:G-protein coupled receptors family 3 profile domain-containing protein n=2 Tax=Schistosoma margrebowiei TaxID=48269 RepID=A0AA84ZJL8_9TREM|nr:unnamed protein product [Schistosoma margrebowiei]
MKYKVMLITLLIVLWSYLVTIINCFQRKYDKHTVASIPGDIMLGGLFPVHTSGVTTCESINPERGIQRVEAMLFTLDEINNNTNLLPGLTLGTTIRDTCSDTNHALEQALKFVQASTGSSSQLNKMNEQSENLNTRGVVGSSYSSVTILVANLFRLFSLPQISYASTTAVLSDKRAFPLFARTVPSDVVQAQAMATLVSAHNWTYVSTVRSAGDYGDSGMDAFWKEADKLGVCIAAREVIRGNTGPEDLDNIVNVLSKDFAKARVVVLFTGMDHTKLLLDAVRRAGLVNHFVWIASDGWGRENVPVSNNSREANGALTIEIQAEPIKSFTDYYLSLGRENHRNPWFREYWQDLVQCRESSTKRRERKSTNSKRYFMSKLSKNETNLGNSHEISSETSSLPSSCSDSPDLRLRDILGPDFKQEAKIQFVYDAVYAFASGLHILQKKLCPGNPLHPKWNKRDCLEKMLNYPGTAFYQLIINTSFTDNYGNYVAFDENGDGYGQYSIYNYARDPYTGQYHYRLVGDFQGGKLTMRARPIWPGGESKNFPISQCSEECGFGEVRRLDKKQQCCWSCETCGVDQRVVNLTHCETCPFQHWPSKDKRTCELLELHYIDISTWFAIVPITFSSLGILITGGVILTWVFYSDTPLIRATGRELAYVQLAGCLVCYSCAFILIARPSIFTCSLQRILIGLGFAMMYASLLTKTNRIARIFDAAKRTTKRPVYISPRSQLAISGSLIALQLSLSAIWFGFDSPDTRIDEIRPGYLVLRCAMKDKSFLISLAYNMILIIVCTAYAVKTRQIPENFNESKFIGFTMYTTCIIWLAFLPMYYATISNHQIQIATLCISINLSASVMLCCLFFPKLYIIYLRPEKNVRRLTMNNMTAKQKFANLVKEKSTINMCVSSYASDNTSLTVSSSTKTGLQTDSDKGILTSPGNPTQSTVTSTNCLKLDNQFFNERSRSNSSITQSVQVICNPIVSDYIASVTTTTPSITKTSTTLADDKQSSTYVNTLFINYLNQKQNDYLSNKSCNNFPTPTPLLLDNIPNRLSLIKSVYCDEDNVTTEDEDNYTISAKTSFSTINSNKNKMSTIKMNNFINDHYNSTTIHSNEMKINKMEQYSQGQNSEFNQLSNEYNHNQFNKISIINNDNNNNNISKCIPSQFTNRNLTSFSPTISLGSIESPNLSVPSSDLYNPSYCDDTIMPNSENNDSSYRDNESLFVRINKQKKTNSRNIDYTKQTVTAL